MRPGQTLACVSARLREPTITHLLGPSGPAGDATLGVPRRRPVSQGPLNDTAHETLRRLYAERDIELDSAHWATADGNREARGLMRRPIVSEFVLLDGVIQAPGGTRIMMAGSSTADGPCRTGTTISAAASAP
jgi:hypothetical protein